MRSPSARCRWPPRCNQQLPLFLALPEAGLLPALGQHPVGPLLAWAHQVAQLGEVHRDRLGDQPERREQPVPVLEQCKDQQEE